MPTPRNLLAKALQRGSWIPNARDAEEGTLCVAPFFHAYGMTAGMNLSILAAATMVLLPQFRAKEVIKAIGRYHPTQLPGIPTMYVAIMREVRKHPEALPSIKYWIRGASAFPAPVRINSHKST